MQSTQNLVTALVTPARTLRDAASYLARYGWIQGFYYDPSATVFTPAACLVGALGMVCYGGPVDAPAQQFDDPGFDDFQAAYAFMSAYLDGDGGLYGFNDTRGRTADQVIQALKAAAEDWDNTDTESADALDRVLRDVADMYHRMDGGAV